ncbi:hypothetical protein [Coprobacter fastidiosus]|uniref:hypothetical protein n=1 Tax=Coprobacter fastidiosus TaxID=1099853 RepID=UPI0026705CB5|nr:hypothetical protein [Coprobacter fastidiosus]
MESFKSSIFKDKALKALSGKWKPSVIVSLVTMLIIGWGQAHRVSPHHHHL